MMLNLSIYFLQILDNLFKTLIWLFAFNIFYKKTFIDVKKC